MSDDEHRDHAWLEALFRRHHQAVLAYARRRVPIDQADDVLAEVFAAAWRHRDRVPDPALPWLYRTASHHVLHVYRGTARRERLVERVAGSGGSGGRGDQVGDHADDVARTIDDGLRVRAIMSRLPPRDAEVLRLDAWEQLDNEQIAYVLGCARTSARVRLHRARRRFAQLLTAQSDSDLIPNEVAS